MEKKTIGQPVSSSNADRGLDHAARTEDRMTEARITGVAARILEKYREGFEELAK